jgi:hypothetical protein
VKRSARFWRRFVRRWRPKIERNVALRPDRERRRIARKQSKAEPSTERPEA